MSLQDSHQNVCLEDTKVFDEIFARCVEAYSDITLRGYRRDLETFAEWCVGQGERFVPASPAVVAAFLDDQLATYSCATIRRRVSAIKFLHHMSDVPSPI